MWRSLGWTALVVGTVLGCDGGRSTMLVDLQALRPPPAAAFTITGRPDSTSTQHNEQVSCGGAEASAEVRVQDSGGRATDALVTGALSDCGASIYGRWNIEVEIDGERSNGVEVVYCNSGCPGVASCAEARTACGGVT